MSVKELIAKIDYFVQRYSAKGKPSGWIATPDWILAKVQQLCPALSETQH